MMSGWYNECRSSGEQHEGQKNYDIVNCPSPNNVADHYDDIPKLLLPLSSCVH